MLQFQITYEEQFCINTDEKEVGIWNFREENKHGVFSLES